MPTKVTLIHGGGIGYDTVPAVQRILKAAGADIEWQEIFAGGEAIQKGLEPLPKSLFESLKTNGLALKTRLLADPVDGHHNFNLELRRQGGLFASIRPIKNLRGLKGRFQNVDMLVVRELSEDLYASIEHEIVPGVVQSIKVVTEKACQRFFHSALTYAREAGRKSVTCVHKANILKLADGLFLDVFRRVAREFPELATKEMIVDNCCMQMVSKPQQFDVLVMGNLYGDIVSDLGAGLVGGISATAGINLGDGFRIFETFHGGPRDAIGADRANPLPLLLPAIDLVESLGQKDLAQRIMTAAETVLEGGETLTADLGGQATTTQMTDAIVAAL